MKKSLVLLALLFAFPAWSATYYVDCAASGDSGAGTSATTAWKTIGRVNSSSFKPGDSILFNRGCTWRESLWPSWSGTSGNPITFGAYGTGANPVISGAALITSWTLDSGSIWKATLAADPSYLWVNGTVGTRESSKAVCVAANEWYWASSVLYLYAPSNPGSYYTNPGVEYRANDWVVGFSGDYLVFDGLTIEKGAYANLGGTSNHGVIQNCIIQYSGSGGGIHLGGIANPAYTDWKIHDNVCRFNAVMGISVIYRGTHIQVYRNECYENDTVINDTGGGWRADQALG